MKIALCLYGVIGSAKGKAHLGATDGILPLGYKKYYENIIVGNDVDVFVHSWSKDKEDDILFHYEPVRHKIEKQEVFNIPSYIKGNRPTEPKRVEFVFSRWRSTQKVLQEKMNYEKEKGFEYDLCLLTRFDVAFETKIDFFKIKGDKINFSNWYGVKYDQAGDIFKDGRGIFYELSKRRNTDDLPRFGRGYPHDAEGILDYWILSGNKINTFALVFDNLPEYFKPGRCPGAPWVSNHKVILHHMHETNNIDNIDFILDPTKDHSMIRWKYFNSKK